MKTKYSKGKGYLNLVQGKRSSVWYFTFREYVDRKLTRRKVRVGTVEEFPDRAAAEAAVTYLRNHGQINIIEGLARERRTSERKSLPVYSQDWFTRKLAEQNGRCPICQGMPKRFVVDHDHSDGELRGLLCQTCNSGIGMLRDEPALLRAALLYLESYGGLLREIKAAEPTTTTTQ